MRPKANPGTDGGGGDGGRRPRRTAWCASILLVVTTLVTLNIVGVILRSAVERETTDQTYRRQMMARFYRGDPFRQNSTTRRREQDGGLARTHANDNSHNSVPLNQRDATLSPDANFTAQFPKDGIDIAAVRDSTRGKKTEIETLPSFLAWQRTLESRERKVFSQQGEDGVKMALRKSGNQREARNAIGVSGASVPGACTAPPESSNRSVNIGCKPYDFYFYASGDIVSSAISQSGQWETKNTRMVLDALRRPNANGRLLDIGANLGWFSLAAASCGFDVVAIEPFAMNQALVEASSCANGFHNEIKLIKSGLDTVARTCSLYQVPHVNIGDTHSVCSTSVDGEEMKRNFESEGYKKLGTTETTTLDELYRTKALGTRKFDILKIDVEGFESRVLLGGNAFFGSELAPASILIEMTSPTQKTATGRGGDTLVMIRSMLEAYGYTHAATHNLHGDGFVRAIDGQDMLFVKTTEPSH